MKGQDYLDSGCSQHADVLGIISDFIFKVCTLEMYIEFKRQALGQREDFEPYIAFQKLCRVGDTGVTHESVCRFLDENRLAPHLMKAFAMVSHYDSDSDGVVSYKDFLDLMLPKEHP